MNCLQALKWRKARIAFRAYSSFNLFDRTILIYNLLLRRSVNRVSNQRPLCVMCRTHICFMVCFVLVLKKVADNYCLFCRVIFILPSGRHLKIMTFLFCTFSSNKDPIQKSIECFIRCCPLAKHSVTFRKIALSSSAQLCVCSSR